MGLNLRESAARGVERNRGGGRTIFFKGTGNGVWIDGAEEGERRVRVVESEERLIAYNLAEGGGTCEAV